MSRLTERAFWDAAYTRAGQTTFDPTDPTELNDRRRWRSHADRVLWDELLPTYVEGPPEAPPGRSVLEIGSAPGRNLVRLHRRFGLDPWGVEYSAQGAALNRQRFVALGLDPAQVLELDVFSEAFLAACADRFDVVFSMGFIEHFADPAAAVQRHLAACRVGGLLVVTVPNMRGLNLALTSAFDRSLVPLHNLEIMDRAALAAAFPAAQVQPLFCGYYGSLDLGAFTTPHPLRRAALRGLRLAQRGVSGALGALPAPWRPEHRWLSPFLAFIGRRVA
jgi:SAM-dependent methyltransferase